MFLLNLSFSIRKVEQNVSKGLKESHYLDAFSFCGISNRSLTNGRGSWVVGRGYKPWVVGVGVGVV